MYLALLVFIAIASIVVYSLLKLVRGIFSGKSRASDNDGSDEKQRRDKKPPKKSKKEEENELKEEVPQAQVEQPKTLEERMEEEDRTHYLRTLNDGITESFWMEAASLPLESKELADLITRASSLTYLEFNNRHLADNKFEGFNIQLAEGQKITLTYQGQAIATLTKVETTSKKSDKPLVMYRTNTFPPTVSLTMNPLDVSAMLQARDSICRCEGNPDAAFSVMMSKFTDAENLTKLKRNIDSKIQAKESKQKQSQTQSLTTKAAKLK